jgi:two-component system sensor histidine kinase PhoQ
VQGRFNEQIERMDEIVRYQLRKPAASTADNLVLGPVPVAQEVERLVSGLRKVHHDKQPRIDAHVAPEMKFRGDTGDFLELAGNLLDNACKWCKGRVSISVRPSGDTPAGAGGMVLTVDDDGPGIPEEAAEALLERGTRLDEATPGHGIGLAIVRDLAQSYGGSLTIGRSSLGGASITVDIPTAAERR